MGAVAQTAGRPSPPRTLEQRPRAGLGSIVFGHTIPTRHRMVMMYVFFALNDVFVIAMAITPSFEAGLVFVGAVGGAPCGQARPGGCMRSPEEILGETKTIALVGASPNPSRPSHDVMRYLLAQGYRVIPVRPADCTDVLGVSCVSSLAEIEEPIDLVDVFRREDAAPEHAREAVEAGAKAFWLQLGLRSPEARRIVTEAGLDYVEDLCTAVVHRNL